MESTPLNSRSIFVRAIEIDAPAEREAYLAQACQNDPDLKGKVEALLNAYQEAGSFLEHPPAPADITLDMRERDRAGALIGPYKLLQEIGEGGMGRVFLAEQTRPVQRKVALKVIRSGMDGNQILARFEAERQALAMMDHPNIAKVLDAGTSGSGQPYFVMELVKGVPITRYCDEHHLTPQQRLELFIPVCEAVQHAHQKGIMHRDLKPSNVLVAQYDGRPVPKVIDFGVAKATGSKLTDRTLFTEFGAVVGTLEYMSPEQAEMNQLDTDTRSDIYSLGVLMYELLTGTTPLERQKLKDAAMSEVLRRIREEEPPPPSTRLSTTQQLASIATNRGVEARKLSGMVHGELDWIVMKALEKDRVRRYDTATGLAADVRRYLDDEPVLARPASAMYRAKKFIRKHRVAVGAASAIVLALVLGLGAAAFGLVRATNARNVADQRALTEEAAKKAAQIARDGEARQRKQTEAALASAQANAYSTQIKLAYEYWQRDVISQAEKSLDDCPPPLRNWEWNYLHRLCHADLMTLKGHTQPVTDVRYSRDGKRLMSFTFYGFSAVRVWDAVTGREIRKITDTHSENFSTAEISPDGQIIATGSAVGSVDLWNVSDGRQQRHFKLFSGKVASLSFSRDSQFLAAAGQGSPAAALVTKVWRISGGEPVFAQTGTSGLVTFSPDGKWLLTTAPSPLPQILAPIGTEMKLWDTITWKQARTLGYHSAVTFSGDGRLIAVTTPDRSSDSWTISILNATTGQETSAIKTPGGVGDVALNTHGDQIAAAGGWGSPMIRVWDVRSGKQIARLRGHTDSISAVAYSPDGSRLISGSWDRLVKVWDPRSSGEVVEFPGRAVQSSSNVAMDSHGTLVAYSQANVVSLLTGRITEITLWDIRAGKITHSLRGHEQPAESLALSSEGSILVSGSKDRTARSWDTASGKELFVFRGHTGPVTAVAVSPDGQWAASSDEDPALVEINRTRVMPTKPFELTPILIRVWNTHTGKERCSFAGQTGNINVLCFSPDGTQLASAALNDVRLWDSTTGRQVAACQGAFGSILSVAFAPDGRRLAASSYGNNDNDRAIRIWDAISGHLLQTLRGHGRDLVRSMAFSPDGSRLASAAGADLKLWDAAGGTDLLSLPGTPDSIYAIHFTPDGQRLIAASSSGSIKLWNASGEKED